MNLKKRFFVLFIFCLIATSVFAKPKVRPKAVLTKTENSWFWTISGTDKKGKPATIYVLGTIHIGDEKLYPVSDEIMKAFYDANRVSWEISSKDYPKVNTAVTQKYKEGVEKYYKNGIKLSEQLTDEELDILESVFGKSGLLPYLYYEPWVLQNVFSSKITEDLKLSSQYSYDIYFSKKCFNNDIKFEGLDDLQTQVDLLSFGDYEFQLNNLKSLIAEYKEDKNSMIEQYNQLYKMYLTYDEEVFNNFNEESIKKDMKGNSGMEAYYKAMFLDRNTNWAVKFDEYLKKGGITFIFAGCGHFVGSDSVFNIMRKNGTLE